jgi:hypothetical protein
MCGLRLEGGLPGTLLVDPEIGLAVPLKTSTGLFMSQNETAWVPQFDHVFIVRTVCPYGSPPDPHVTVTLPRYGALELVTVAGSCATSHKLFDGLLRMHP